MSNKKKKNQPKAKDGTWATHNHSDPKISILDLIVPGFNAFPGVQGLRSRFTLDANTR